MAIVRAIKSGSWSDTTVWNTGVLPTSADDVYSNAFTVTIDISPTVLSVQNGATTGVTAGGGFAISQNNITVTASSTGFLQAANVTLLTVSTPVSQSTALVGVVNGVRAATSNTPVINFSGAGTLNVIGNLTSNTGGSTPNSPTVLISGAGSLLVTGSVTGPLSGNTSNTAPAITVSNNNATVSVTGDVTGSASGSNFPGVSIGAAAVVSIIGNVVASAAPGVISSSAPTLTHIGISTATNNVNAINIISTSSVVNLTGPFIVSANGTHAVFCPVWRWHASIPTSYYQVRTQTSGTIRPLYTGDSVGGNPATNNVRSGTIYGPSNELTGTCAVPAAGSVALGVAVDNTTGTAVLTQANVRTALGMASANLDTQLAAIPTTAAPTVSAIRTEMDSNSTKLANLDATVSSRSTYNGSDTSGTTTLLSRLTSTRAGYLDNIASAANIAAAVWAAVTRTITGGTVDTLTNAPTVPTPSQIASQVRTELSTELGRIDATVSSRLAPADTLARVTLVDTTTTLTNAPDVPTEAEIAAAVRTELTPELERVANCATVETTGDQIAGLQ